MGIELVGLQVPETIANAWFRAFSIYEKFRDTNLIHVAFFRYFDTDEIISSDLQVMNLI